MRKVTSLALSLATQLEEKFILKVVETVLLNVTLLVRNRRLTIEEMNEVKNEVKMEAKTIIEGLSEEEKMEFIKEFNDLSKEQKLKVMEALL